MGPKKHYLAKLRGGGILAPNALINKWPHLHIHNKVLGHCLKMVCFAVKNSSEPLVSQTLQIEVKITHLCTYSHNTKHCQDIPYSLQSCRQYW